MGLLRGPSAATRGGGAPVPARRLGARTVCCRLRLLLPSIAPLRQKAAQEPRIRQDAPCPPQDPATGTPASNLPVTCQCAPYPGLVSGAQDPGERPHPSPTPQPCSPGTRLSSLPPAPPVISCRRPFAKDPHTPQARPSEAGSTSPPRSSSPAWSSRRAQGSRRCRLPCKQVHQT